MGLFDDKCDKCNRKAEYISSRNDKLCAEDWDVWWKDHEKRAQYMAQNRMAMNSETCNEGHDRLEPSTCDACATVVHDVVQEIRDQRAKVEEGFKQYGDMAGPPEDNNPWGLDIPDKF